MKELTLKAYGKINLGLDVVRRREDGYHEVKMIMQTVELHDVITLRLIDTAEIRICSAHEKVPCDETNLAYKAAKRMMDLYQLSTGVEITIEKNIPVAAGMAGGSTDCAAVLKGMNELYELGLSEKQLQEIGVKLGADVPYCIMGGTALSEGIGEILSKLPAPPQWYVLLAKPDIDVSTKYVYEHLNLAGLSEHPDIDGMIAAMKAGDREGFCSRMSNVLETVTGTEYPIIGEIEQMMREGGADVSIMSGSGPTVFGLFREKQQAMDSRERILENGLANEVHVTTFWTR